MTKFEVGDRVKCTGNLHWVGEGTVRALYETNVSVIMLTGKMSGEIGAFRPSDLEPIVTFQPGDIVRAEKGDAIAQDALRTIGSIETLWLREWRISDYEEKGYTLTLVKRPEAEIVLPTKKNALIEIDSWFYIRGFGGAWSTIGNFARVSHSSMETRARKSGFYRVIFEGENE